MDLRTLMGRAKAHPVMLVPFIRDCDDWRKQDEVKAQCRHCAELLSTHLFVWHKKFPSVSTVKSWDVSQGRFVGMDLSLFQDYVMQHFSIKTKDNREWLFDRSIAALIWEQCVAPDSPLPEANFDIEAERRRAA